MVAKNISKAFVSQHKLMETNVVDFICNFMKVVYHDELIHGFSKYQKEKCLSCLEATNHSQRSYIKNKEQMYIGTTQFSLDPAVNLDSKLFMA